MKKRHPYVWLVVLSGAASTSVLSKTAFDLSDQWFNSDVSSVSASDQPVVFKLDQSCHNKTQLEADRSVTEALHNELAIDLDLPLNEQSLFKDYSRFWRFKDQYYQLTAVWEYDVPALYRIEFYQSDSPAMNRSIKQLSHPSIKPHQVDAIAVEQTFAAVMGEYLDQGAVAGASIMVSTVQDDMGNYHEVTFLNQQPVSWAQGEQVCQLDEQASFMNCVCDQKHAHNHGEES